MQQKLLLRVHSCVTLKEMYQSTRQWWLTVQFRHTEKSNKRQIFFGYNMACIALTWFSFCGLSGVVFRHYVDFMVPAKDVWCWYSLDTVIIFSMMMSSNANKFWSWLCLLYTLVPCQIHRPCLRLCFNIVKNILHNYVNLTQTEKSRLPPFVYISLHTNFARDAIGK